MLVYARMTKQNSLYLDYNNVSKTSQRILVDTHNFRTQTSTVSNIEESMVVIVHVDFALSRELMKEVEEGECEHSLG